MRDANRARFIEPVKASCLRPEHAARWIRVGFDEDARPVLEGNRECVVDISSTERLDAENLRVESLLESGA